MENITRNHGRPLRMAVILLFCLSFFSTVGFTQNKIEYKYDAAGNRISRRYIITQQKAKSPSSVEPVKTNITSDEVNIDIYPNPVHDILQVKVSGTVLENKIILQLLNDGGGQLQKVKSSYTGSLIEVNMSSYLSGMYFLNVFIDDKNYQFKIIKQ